MGPSQPPERSSRVSDRARSITPQQIRVMFDLAAQREADPAFEHELVHLEIGEPDFDTPEHVIEAAHRAALDGATRYTANAGLFELREAIAEEYRAARDHDVDPKTELVVTTGGVEAHHLAIHAVADPGEEIVIPTPAWPNSISQAKLADAVPVEVPLCASDGFEPDPDRIIDAIGPTTAAVILTSPSNPTGRIVGTRALERILEAAVANEAYVLADEVYRGLIYDATPPAAGAVATDEQRQWLLTIDSISKRYAMTGWRVGWLAGPDDVVHEIVTLREHTTSSVNAPAQYAAIAALTGPQEPFQEMKAAFRERRDYVLEHLGRIPSISPAYPEGAFYVFVDVSALAGTSEDIARRLLDDYGVVTAPGTAFGAGGEGHIRLSFATALETLEVGLDRLESMVRSELE